MVMVRHEAKTVDVCPISLSCRFKITHESLIISICLIDRLSLVSAGSNMIKCSRIINPQRASHNALLSQSYKPVNSVDLTQKHLIVLTRDVDIVSALFSLSLYRRLVTHSRQYIFERASKGTRSLHFDGSQGCGKAQ